MTEGMLELIEACVKARLNILICGGTGSGKTTLLNVLSCVHPGRRAHRDHRRRRRTAAAARPMWRAWKRVRANVEGQGAIHIRNW